MAADDIAKVVADLKQHRLRLIEPRKRVNDAFLDVADQGVAVTARDLISDPVVVDCTTIYKSLVEKDEPVYMYEDHPCVAPPWPEAAFCYVNEHDNVMVAHAFINEEYEAWETENIPDWNKVKWVLDIFLWLGGRSSSTGPFPTTGPVMWWRFAIGEQGEPLDLSWVHIVEKYPMKNWDMAQLVVLGALNFLACKNVDIIEPERPRKERRRIERTGVRVHEIVVSRVGQRVGRASQSSSGTGATPLTSVRGHFAEYGPRYGKGLLFGKIEGRFWIPQYARGDREYGEDKHDYRLKV